MTTKSDASQKSIEEIDEQEILDRLREIISESLSVAPEKITIDSYIDDLGADSLDFLEIAFEVESAFNISLPDKNILQTAEEVVGPGVLVSDGFLTEMGKKLIRHRMSELEKQLEGDVSLNDVYRMMARVGSWLRMIQRLIEHTPRQCPECGAPLSDSVAGRFKCRNCDHVFDAPSGEEINKRWVEEYREELGMTTPTCPQRPAEEGRP